MKKLPSQKHKTTTTKKKKKNDTTTTTTTTTAAAAATTHQPQPRKKKSNATHMPCFSDLSVGKGQSGKLDDCLWQRTLDIMDEPPGYNG